MPVDPRFYRFGDPLTAGDIARRLGEKPAGDSSCTVTNISEPQEAGPNDLCFFDGKQRDWEAFECRAGLCLVSNELDLGTHAPDNLIQTSAPRTSFFDICHAWISEEAHKNTPPAIHASAEVHEMAFVSNGAAIGERTQIGPYAFIGPGVQIGRDCEISAHVSVRYALIGDRVRLQAGARIGEDGFGVVPTASGAMHVAHYGRAILQDGVSIGANSCVDRGLIQDTVVGENSKIDNLCHIGHNTIVGRNVLIAAYGGISGSVMIGDGVMMGGRVGIADHVSIGEGARLVA
ncbi:MAG: UDP-3-O-(3-hydroxymyristoyl)glucosamine N-acyltransferase, partial [Pseudomonadota bacterium]